MNLRGDINIAQKKMGQYRVLWYIITKKVVRMHSWSLSHLNNGYYQILEVLRDIYTSYCSSASSV